MVDDREERNGFVGHWTILIWSGTFNVEGPELGLWRWYLVGITTDSFICLFL